MKDSDIYTHAEWLVLPGREDEFIAAWKELGSAFGALEHPPLWGSLLRSSTEPRLFYSFGPWRSADDVTAMRSHAPTLAVLQRVRSLCERATPAGYERVAHIDLTSSADSARKA
jgi:hypothetical protein